MARGNGTWTKQLAHFYSILSSKKASPPTTSEAYRNDLKQFWDFLEERRNGSSDGAYSWESVDLNLLNDYVTNLRGLKGYRDTTTARKVAAIRSFFGFLFENDSISQDPTESMGSPRVGRSLPKFLSKDEVAHLLEIAARAVGNDARRDATILELLYATGLRVGELVSLNVTDIDLQESYIRCWGKGSKERMVYFYPRP